MTRDPEQSLEDPRPDLPDDLPDGLDDDEAADWLEQDELRREEEAADRRIDEYRDEG